jgi:septal ring factor EnvC (AmiA/AmiB activator)
MGKRFITVIAVAISIVTAAGSSAWGQQTKDLDKTIQDKKGNLTEIEKEINKKKQEVKKKWWMEKKITDALDKIERQAERKKQDLRRLDSEMKALEKRVDYEEEEIARLESRVTSLGELFQSRVRSMYKLHRVGLVRVLFSADNYSDVLRWYKVFQLVMENDLQLLQSYQGAIHEEKKRKHALIAEQADHAKKKGEVETKKKEIEGEMRVKATVLASVQNERVAQEKAIAELKEREKALRSLIQELTAKATTFTPPPTTATSFKALRGKLPPPARGEVFAPKGRERGLGIKAPEGTQIQAIYAGRVVYASWFKGYGNLIIIDHGDGYHTVTAHASSLLKKVGDEVKIGEVVALVGSTGSIEGPMLYFEIRYHGKAIDPGTWLALPSYKKGNGKG